MPKITIAASQLRQALEGIECPSPQKTALWNELRSGYLDFVVEQIIQGGLASDVVESIRFLVKHKSDTNKKTQRVTLGDIDRSSSNNVLYKRIDEKQGKERSAHNGDLSRLFGTRGHDAIPKLFSGELLKLSDPKAKGAQMVQQELALGGPDGEINFDIKQGRASYESTSQKLVQRHIKKVASLWSHVVRTMAQDMFPAHTGHYRELLEALHKVFGQELDKLSMLGKRSEQAEYMLFLSTLTWATTILYYQDFGTKILFKEVSLFPYHYDVSLGRIDALEVVAIRGIPPTPPQKEVLKRLASVRYDSLGHLLYILVQQFGKGISIIIHDWKFAVGDGDNGVGKTLNIIHTADVQNAPILKHKNQMDRYLSTAPVSYGVMLSEHTENRRALWNNNDFEISGALHYFFPNRLPIRYDVVMSNDEKRESFGRIAASYADAEYRRKFLTVSRSWLELGLTLAEQGQLQKKQALAQPAIPGVLETTSVAKSVHATGKVSAVLRDSVIRNFIDEFEIVEQVEIKSESRLFMHLDALFSAIEQGKVAVGKNWDFATGGFVSCFLPDHAHHGKGTPSLSITYKNGGFFKCFGACGATGHFALDSVPKPFEGLIQPANARLQIKSFSDLEAFRVSPRHIEIMTSAQRIFQNQFLDSPGARYLEQERRLNPELSMKHGAGYADERSVEYLLESGFTYDELITFGFVVLSHNIKEYGRYSTMVDILKKRGMSVDQIVRPKMKTVDGKPQAVPTLPLLALNKHVTYPLDINHTVTSFYGRSVPDRPKEYSHVKTISQGVPQGGYNFTNAMESAIAKARKSNDTPMIFGTEAIIDADTQMQFGDIKEGGAFVGIRNRMLWQVLAMFKGGIITALNWDPSNIVDGKERGMSGQRATADFVAFLKQVNFHYPVYDFTQEMIKKVPSFNDINQYWKESYKEYFVHHRVQNLARPEMLFCKKRVL